MWAMVYIYSALIIFLIGLVGNVLVFDNYANNGLKLLQFLLPVEMDESDETDLKLVMELIYLNKNRLKFIK